MSQVINTNVASLNAQRNLQSSQSSLATSLQRLSSGLRINSAKDDAAGLAISERFTTQIRGINQAIRNANDGISLAQVGESALAEVTTNLQRIRELAVQSANATNSDSDRLALDLEVQQRLQEIDRVASQTAFNGRKLLDGSFGNATFQIGAEAGQSINLNLGANASTRLSAIGQVAQASSSALGAASTGGTYSVNANTLNFGTAGADATAGRVTFQLDSVDFGTTDVTATNGTAQFTAAAFDFTSGSLTSGAALTATDYTGAGVGPQQFDVVVDLGLGTEERATITLTQDYGSLAGVATEIQNQLQATTGFEDFTAELNGTNNLVITNVGDSRAVTVADAAGAATVTTFTGNTSTAGSAQPLAQFEVDGQLISLDGDYTDATGLAAALETAIQGLGDLTGSGSRDFTAYTVTNSGNIITIDDGEAGGDGVAITNANASAIQGGIQNTTGTDGIAGAQANDGGFVVDSAGNNIAIVLDQDYGSNTAVADAIQTQLDTANSGAYAGQYSVSVDAGGQMTIARTTTGVGSAAVTIDNEVVNTAGQSTYSADTSTAGAAAVATTNANFEVDGIEVTLDDNYADGNALRAAIATQLGSGYSVTGTGNEEVIITNNAPGSDAVTISNADPNAFNSGFVNGSGTAGTVAGSIDLTDFSINGVEVEGSFASVDDLATQINTSVSGVFATADGGALRLTSASEITLGGADATTTMGFSSTSIAADSGSLSGSNVQTVADANAMIQSIDSALTSVSTFRSTFGAIQNRFESVTANLTTSVENLSASRSRILDADFAAETANLTRAQILQQAGVAMLAQANALPQNVLSLLR